MYPSITPEILFVDVGVTTQKLLNGDGSMGWQVFFQWKRQ